MQNVIYVNDTLKNVSDLTDSDKQTIAERLVSQEIYYCVSRMISELSQDPNCTYIDAILEFSSKPDELDPMEAANEDDWYSYSQLKESFDFESPEFQADLHNMLNDFELAYEERQNFFYQATLNGIIDINSNCDDWQDLCEHENIDLHSDDYTEALEHWIVSDWLAHKLEEWGQLVTLDFLGLTIWGRTCSGQAIYLDHVIQEIAIDAYSFEQEKPFNKESIPESNVSPLIQDHFELLNIGANLDNY